MTAKPPLGAPAPAPAGSLWGRDKTGLWHVLRAAQLGGAPGGPRRHANAVCGVWHGVGSRAAGRWAELTRGLPPAARLCPRCLAKAPDADRALRLAAEAPAPEQGRLF